MNPSANGWIKKLLNDITNSNNNYLSLSLDNYYKKLKSSGFIYGANISVVNECIENKDFTNEELCKVNLVLGFYFIHHKSKNDNDFIESIISFYNAIDDYKTSFFSGLLGEKDSTELLEKMIDKRVYIDDNVLTKTFNYFITNALLFVDLIAYEQFLKLGVISDNYIKNIEAAIESMVLMILETKSDKTKYDDSLIKLFESSLRFQSNSRLSYKNLLKKFNSKLSKYYIIDIACMAFWSDKIISTSEQNQLLIIGKDLKLNPIHINQSILDIDTFYSLNKDKIMLLSSKNMIQSFYDNSSKMVSKLIKRNSKRLLNELKESKELMVLLTKSTTRELTQEEQKKVQNQLLDIIKSIPSLAIFMLPGGAILLPLFVKFIPKLLPSAFDENRIKED
jgi:hypothetical protein